MNSVNKEWEEKVPESPAVWVTIALDYQGKLEHIRLENQHDEFAKIPKSSQLTNISSWVLVRHHSCLAPLNLLNTPFALVHKSTVWPVLGFKVLGKGIAC